MISGHMPTAKPRITIPLTDVPVQADYVGWFAAEALRKLVRSGRFIGGEAIEQFEDTVADRHGVNHCIACDSGSAALMTAMFACGLEGERFATPAMTFISVLEAAKFIGATPVCYDILPSLWMMQPHDYAQKPCEAAIPVALYGRHISPKFYERDFETLIVDAAQAHGQKFYNEFTAMTLSFYPGKVVGAFGDGGAVLTNNDHIASIARAFVNHGRLPGEKYVHSRLGFNFRMDALQAIVLTMKYKYLDEWLAGRQKVAERYTEVLSSLIRDYTVYLPDMDASRGHSWHLYVVLIDESGVDRSDVFEFMRAEGVGVGVHYPVPLHKQPVYSQLGFEPCDSLPVSEMLGNKGLSLPIFPEMTEDQVVRVSSLLAEGVKKCKKE